MAKVIEFRPQSDGSHRQLSAFEKLMAGLLQRDKNRGITRRGQRVRAAIVAGAAVAGAVLGVEVALNTPDTYGNGTVMYDDGHFDLTGKAGSGDTASDAAYRILRASVAQGEETQGLVLDVSQEEFEDSSQKLAKELSAADLNPADKVIDLPEDKRVAVTFANGTIKSAHIVQVDKQ